MNRTYIVDSHEVDYASEYVSLPSSKTVIKTNYTLWAGKDKVRLVYSQKVTGINKHSGKRYYRWQPVHSIGFYRTSSGKIVPFGVEFKGKKVAHRSLAHLAFNPSCKRELTEQYFTYLADIFGLMGPDVYRINSVNLGDIYPLTRHWNLRTYSQLPSGYIGLFRSETLPEFTVKLFGKKNYRKDLVKAVGNLSDPRVAILASAFKGRVPVDWIVTFLRNNSEARFRNPSKQYITTLNNILNNIDPRSYRRLLFSNLDRDEEYALLDTLNLVGRRAVGDLPDIYGGGIYRNFRELHRPFDYGGRGAYAVAEPFEETEIKLVPLAEKIDGQIVAGYTIYPAHHTEELSTWGHEMRNCISGYKQDAASGRGIYGAVYRDADLVANFEIVGTKLRQLLGKCNQKLAEQARVPLEKFFAENGLDISDYWGKV